MVIENIRIALQRRLANVLKQNKLFKNNELLLRQLNGTVVNYFGQHLVLFTFHLVFFCHMRHNSHLTQELKTKEQEPLRHIPTFMRTRHFYFRIVQLVNCFYIKTLSHNYTCPIFPSYSRNDESP